MTFEDRCLRETVRLHSFPEAWLVGTPGHTPEALASETAPAVTCSVVSPLGTRTLRKARVAEFQGLHDVLAADRGRFAARMRNVRVEAPLGDRAVPTDEEGHERGEDRADAKGAHGGARGRPGPHPRDLAAWPRAHGGGTLPEARGAGAVPRPTARRISASALSIVGRSPAPATKAPAGRASTTPPPLASRHLAASATAAARASCPAWAAPQSRR